MLRLTALLGLIALSLAAPLRAEVSERASATVVAPADPSKIEVIEVFGYWCIHCASFRQPLEDWARSQPADVQLTLLPAVFSGGMEDELARAFYAAEAMGALDRLHPALFDAVAVKRQVRDRDGILATASEAGVDAALLAATMDSFSVRAKAAQAKSLMPRYGVGVTPTLIVNGRTLLEPAAGGFEAMLKRTEALIEQARQSTPAP